MGLHGLCRVIVSLLLISATSAHYYFYNYWRPTFFVKPIYHIPVVPLIGFGTTPLIHHTPAIHPGIFSPGILGMGNNFGGSFLGSGSGNLGGLGGGSIYNTPTTTATGGTLIITGPTNGGNIVNNNNPGVNILNPNNGIVRDNYPGVGTNPGFIYNPSGPMDTAVPRRGDGAMG